MSMVKRKSHFFLASFSFFIGLLFWYSVLILLYIFCLSTLIYTTSHYFPGNWNWSQAKIGFPKASLSTMFIYSSHRLHLSCLFSSSQSSQIHRINIEELLLYLCNFFSLNSTFVLFKIILAKLESSNWATVPWNYNSMESLSPAIFSTTIQTMWHHFVQSR